MCISWAKKCVAAKPQIRRFDDKWPIVAVWGSNREIFNKYDNNLDSNREKTRY